MDTMISVQQLGKQYRLRHLNGSAPYRTLRESLARAAFSPVRWYNGRRSASGRTDDFWALRNVSFDVMHGEVVGVIGRNGAGKSTLLKILSRITEPTEGRVTLTGRVASLLEVGTGFHPELSGRENIFLNGAILGMSRQEIQRKFDSIVAFAEVERFLDTPVKRYSSGMHVRLAFAVAAHLEPDILVVDEVLAVGDAEFQKKSLGKIHEVSRGGRTVLFVSHNMAAVQAMCSRSLWLDRGEVAAVGPTAEIIAQYLESAQSIDRDLTGPIALGPTLELRALRLAPNPVTSGEAMQFSLTIAARSATKLGEAALLIYSALEMRVAIIDLRSGGLPVRLEGGQHWTAQGSIASVTLVEGAYRFGLFISSSDFAGDATDIVELTVQPRAHPGHFAPYAAPQRGFVELDVQVTS